MTKYWKLIVTVSQGTVFFCIGSEEVLKLAIEELTNPDNLKEGWLEVHGLCDSCDRAQHNMWIKKEDIIAITLTEMY